MCKWTPSTCMLGSGFFLRLTIRLQEGLNLLEVTPDGLVDYISTYVNQLTSSSSPVSCDALALSLHNLSTRHPPLTAQILDIINQHWIDTEPEHNVRLNDLLRIFISHNAASAELAIELLDRNILQEMGLISSSQILSTRSVRINTGLLYKQQKFNLLREDNEGYAKLSHELNLAMSELPKGRALDLEEMTARCEELLTVVNALIGYFELDPNRVLDNVLDVCSQNLLSHSKFILSFLHHSPWAPPHTDLPLPFASTDNKEKRRRLDMLQSDFTGFYDSEIRRRGGSKLAAQLLGFKLRSLRTSNNAMEKAVASPESLIFLIALLLKSGFIHLSDIYPYVGSN